MRSQDERGSTTIFILVMALALFGSAALVIDGGYALSERRELTNQAEQAARVGADALNQNSLRDGGRVSVDPARARAAADAYLRAVDAPPSTITITGSRVTVTLSTTYDTVLLSVIGMNEMSVSGSGSAESIDADGL
ncbi:TadE/TadG family type IV pilus assembly protein [Aeromicrobium sp. Sec7.5]|uniref:TadE/TadG family type IV pilus assembly protein n=1 Tax=Aeromicrobium sp. Sec7.5 TaxID=3121276 RepID=UPI002FE499B2